MGGAEWRSGHGRGSRRSLPGHRAARRRHSSGLGVGAGHLSRQGSPTTSQPGSTRSPAQVMCSGSALARCPRATDGWASCPPTKFPRCCRRRSRSLLPPTRRLRCWTSSETALRCSPAGCTLPCPSTPLTQSTQPSGTSSGLGALSNDALAAIRIQAGCQASTPAAGPSDRQHSRAGQAVPRRTRQPAADAAPGRWFRLNESPASATVRAHAMAETLLERHGVVTRGSVASEGVRWRFRRGLPSAGRDGGHRTGSARLLRRGAGRCAVLRQRSRRPPTHLRRQDRRTRWPRPTQPIRTVLHSPGPRRLLRTFQGARRGPPLSSTTRGSRSSSSAVVAHCSPGARPDTDRARAALSALVTEVRSARRPPLHLTKVNGDEIHPSPWRDTLQTAGLLLTPRGLRLRAERARVRTPLRARGRAGFPPTRCAGIHRDRTSD